MKKYFLIISSAILLYTSLIFPQQFSAGSPEWLVDMFFNKSSFPDKANYLSGEMLSEINEPTIGEELNGQAKVSFHQIKATNSTCVFAAEVQTESKTVDFYIYLVKDSDRWKINSVRRFLLPAFIYTVRDSLLNLDELSASDSVFLLSLKLFTASDQELKNYLTSNLEKFQELVSLFINNEKDKADVSLASVGCNAVYTDRNYPGCTFIQILKFENMEAGFIQAADAVLIPSISIEEFIYLEEAISGWFIYRTM
jgi:hypothetical protein